MTMITQRVVSVDSFEVEAGVCGRYGSGDFAYRDCLCRDLSVKTVSVEAGV